MRLRGAPLLADENLNPAVLEMLAGADIDVIAVAALGLAGHPDDEILERARMAGRVVVTHDADFGKLAVLAGKPFLGILYLRPGHIDARFVFECVESAWRLDVDLEPPFIVVAERRGDVVKLRVRHGRESFPQGTGTAGVRRSVKALPGRAGETWTDAEDQELRIGWGRGRTLAELSAAHLRTRGAIASRLERLGIVEDRADARARKREG